MVPLLFHFTYIALTLSLGETVICYGLEGLFYVGVALCSLCESSIFSMRVVFSMDASHILPQCVLDVIPLIWGVIVAVVTRACTGCWVGSPFCSVVVTALLGAGLLPSCLGGCP